MLVLPCVRNATRSRERIGFPRQYRTGQRWPVARYLTGEITEPVVISRIEPHYTEEARKGRVQGVVVLQAIVSETGAVTSVRVLKGLDKGLTETVVDTLSQWKSKPALKDGEPMVVYWNTTMSFQLGF